MRGGATPRYHFFVAGKQGFVLARRHPIGQTTTRFRAGPAGKDTQACNGVADCLPTIAVVNRQRGR